MRSPCWDRWNLRRTPDMIAIAEFAIYKPVLLVLATAAVVVPIFHRLRISPVLGYLAAGALLGPAGLGALSGRWPWLDAVTLDADKDIAAIAELGVVFLLFMIGLELSTPRLVTMRRLVFGMGGLQVVASAIVVGLTAPLFGNDFTASVLIGLCLGLSSTAMVLQWLSERRRMSTAVGRGALAVLLLQDLVVIPILFLVGFLADKTGSSLAVGLALALIQAAVMIAAIVFFGRLLLRPFFRLATGAGGEELFMSATLLVAIGAAVLTASAGLSMALGGFVAGILLAETEYRRAIEAAIEPFKGLLLGVFFITVGTRIDTAAILSEPLYLVVCASGLVLIKAAIAGTIARLFGFSRAASIEMGLLLGPGGEFAFIIIGLSAQSGLMPGATAGLLLAVVALSMASIPLLGLLGEHIGRAVEPAPAVPSALLDIPTDERHVIVVGIGRVGRLVSELLSAHKIQHVITEKYAAIAIAARDDGFRAYYGDAKSPAFLKRCGVREAPAMIITIANAAEIDEIVAATRALRTDLPIIARARDAEHARRLYRDGVSDAIPETIEASLQLSEAALVALGVPAGAAIATVHDKRDALRHALQSSSRAERSP